MEACSLHDLASFLGKVSNSQCCHPWEPGLIMAGVALPDYEEKSMMDGG
jgi:hypothetical protein